MRVLDLFSGVGMMAYGMEKAGHKVVAFCEIEEFPRRVLRKHWPDVPIFEDVMELNYERLKEAGVVCDTISKRCGGWQGLGLEPDALPAPRRKQGANSFESSGEKWVQSGARIDIISGGFPCQDLSVAGKQAGITGSRSGLFDEIIRLACELRPRYILLENVAALLTGARGEWAGYVFGRLADIGYDCEWHIIPAGGFETLSAGAPHRRDRVWIVAHAQNQRCNGRAEDARRTGTEDEQSRDDDIRCQSGRQGKALAHAQSEQCNGCDDNTREQQRPQAVSKSGDDGWKSALAHASGAGLEGRQNTGGAGSEREGRNQQPERCGNSEGRSRIIKPRLGNGTDGPAAGLVGHRIAATLADIPVCDSCGEIHNLPTMGHTGPCWMCWGNGSWEQGIPRITTENKQRAAKLKALGNGLMWSIPYAIGRALT